MSGNSHINFGVSNDWPSQTRVQGTIDAHSSRSGDYTNAVKVNGSTYYVTDKGKSALNAARSRADDAAGGDASDFFYMRAHRDSFWDSCKERKDTQGSDGSFSDRFWDWLGF